MAKKKIPKTFSKQMSTYFHLKFIVKMAVLKRKTEKVFVKRFGESKILFKHSKQEGKKKLERLCQLQKKVGESECLFPDRGVNMVTNDTGHSELVDLQRKIEPLHPPPDGSAHFAKEDSLQ